MGGEVLKFPRPERDDSGQKERELAFNVREPKVLEKFDLGNSQNLLGVAQRVVSGCRALLDFIHANRDLSRQAGIETIAIELTTSLESEGFERVLDALEESATEGEPVHLSTEGLGRLRRMEGLLAEASANINRFTYGGHRLAEAARARAQGYRERSLALHGWICAKCGREFERANLHLLTVHHKDGNHQNNPADGSNWENLCADCHDDEHSRGLLGDYLTGKD